ncbi:uncharacterized protein G2W53_014472 [Senna tora]|uniref:Uncharacterized protein n=1 Tax=Senna tora TaxID=362788 RepID=A0A835C470_9FABA|nr:uncharacterized protein G2W53_014472 [Senna tora]
MRDSIPPSKKKAIVSMLDINPISQHDLGKSLHILEGNELKQEGMSSVKNALGIKGSCINRATSAFNLTNKMGYYTYA